jgi:hypothetical protein
VASISVSGPDSRINEATVASIAAAVRRAAWEISQRLGAPGQVPGWSPPPDDGTAGREEAQQEQEAR